MAFATWPYGFVSVCKFQEYDFNVQLIKIYCVNQKYRVFYACFTAFKSFREISFEIQWLDVRIRCIYLLGTPDVLIDYLRVVVEIKFAAILGFGMFKT